MRTLMPTIWPTALVPIFGGFTLGSRLWDVAGRIPSLDLRFAENKSLVDAVTGASLVTFTRASSGTFVGSDGVLRTAVTNLVPGSADLSATYTSLSNVTVSTNTTAAPDGSITSDTVTGASSSSNVKYFYKTYATNTTGTYTASVYLKASTQSIVLLRLNDNSGVNGARQLINLSTGALSGSVAIDGTATGASSTISDVGNGWYRCTVTCTFNSAITALQGPSVFHDGYTTSTSTNSYFAWGAQLEQSATVGEYIPTTSVINSAPRFDHNPTTGESLGLLVEEQRTNLLLRSEEFDTTWARTSASGFGVGSAVNVETAPNGTLTADLIAVANGINSGTGFVLQDITKAATSTTYTVTTFAKAQDWDAVTLHAHDVATNNNRATVTFSLATGVITTAAAAFGTFSAASAITATPFINGWFRVNLTFTSSTETGLRVRLVPNNSTTVTSDGTNGIYLWGAQLEAGATPSSYILNVNTPLGVTRSADVASITGTAFSSWYNQTEGTLFAETRGVLGGGTIFSVDDGTASNRIIASYNFATSTQWRVLAGGVEQLNVNPGGIPATAGALLRYAHAYRANDFGGAANGASTMAVSSGSVPSVNRINIGSNVNSVGQPNGHIRRLTYWPQALPSRLQALTQ